MPPIWMSQLLRQRSMMKRSAKTTTLFIVLFRGWRQETHYWTARCLLEASRLREICRTSNSWNLVCRVFRCVTLTGSPCTIFSREQAVNDNDQLTDSLRLQCLKSTDNWDASKMLSSINVTDDNFNVAMEILQNRYNIRRLILRAHIHGIVAQWAVPTENNRKQNWENFSTPRKRIDFWTWDSR